MRKLKLFFAALALLVGGANSVWGQTDYTSKMSNAQGDWTAATGTNNGGAERYNGNDNAFAAGNVLHQTITELPNGYYKVEFWGWENFSNWNNDATIAYGTGKAQVFANTSVGNLNVIKNTGGRAKDDKNHYTLLTKVTDGSLVYGIKNIAAAGNWAVCVADKLTYIGTSIVAGTDLTYAITNPSFISEYTTGWTLTGTAPNAYNETYGAHEAYHRVGGLHQDLYNLPDGIYKVTMQATWRDDNNPKQSEGSFKLFATSGDLTTKTAATQAPDGNFASNAQKMSEDATFGRIETYMIVTNGNLRIGYYESNGNTWPVFDNFTLTYCGDELSAAAAALDSEANKLNTQITSLAASNLKTELSNFYTSITTASYTSIEEYITAIQKVDAKLGEIADANALFISAKAIADVEYTETTSGSHTTFNGALSSFITSVIDSDEDGDINTAEGVLKTAIKAYVTGAKPTNESDFFDITCLIENPSFDKNTTDGWTYTKNGGSNAASYTCNEFYNNTFDFYQQLTGLPNGSYQLSVQAFSRPGGNGNTTAGAYYDYYNNINNVTAELYINSQSSRVGNIYSYKGNTTAAKDNDFHCTGLGSDDYWVPNSMKGASQYFADDAYITVVAASVSDADEGKLKIGFRDETLTASQWTIFDNFKLYYYGPSLMRYYQQYLPQLKAEAGADLVNASYANVLGGSEDAAFQAALAADPASETEVAYKEVIDNITEKQTAFCNAKSSYDKLVAAIAKATAKSVDHTDADAVRADASATATAAINAANALYKTMIAAAADMTGKVIGFETGEYAPYNVAAAIALNTNEAVAAATSAKLNAVIDAAIANTEEVNAINTALFNGTEYDAAGWTRTQTWNNTATGVYSVPAGTMTYGEVDGFEMPLKANTVYQLTFEHRKWDDGNADNGGKVSVLYNGEGLPLTSYTGHNSKDNTKTETILFKTGTAGNYVFSIVCESARLTFGNVQIKKKSGALESLTIDEDVSYTVEQTVADVTLTRTIKANKWNSIVLPFALSNTELKAAFGDDVKIAEYSEAADGDNSTISFTMMDDDDDAISANVPVLLKTSSAGTSYEFTARAIFTGNPKVAGTNFEFQGSYDNQTYVSNGNYYISANKLYRSGSDTGTYIKGTRAYIKAKGGSGARISGFFIDGEEVTDIEGLTISTDEDGKLYNLNGQEVKNAKKGVFIKNGKKVVIK